MLNLIPCPYWITRVEVYDNSGSNLVAQYYSENIWSQLLYYNNERTGQIAAQQNWSASTYSSSGTTIPHVTGGVTLSPTYYIELSTLLDQLQLPVSMAASYRYRVFFASDVLSNQASNLTDNTQLSINTCQLFVVGRELNDDARSYLQKTIKEGPHRFSAYVQERQIINISSASIAAGTQLTATLTSLKAHTLICGHGFANLLLPRRALAV